MEFVTMLFTGALDIYLHIVIFVKDFYMLFLGKSVAGFATGMTILFFPFAYTTTTMSGNYSFVSKITNFGTWFITFILTVAWLGISNDSDIGLKGMQRSNGLLSFYIFLLTIYAGIASTSKVNYISRGVELGSKDEDKKEED